MIKPQVKNANRHTARGMQALEKSIEQDGWIGAITVAADGETFDGSARVEKTAENGMLEEAITIDIDGTKPVILRRVDIPTADDPRAKRLGIAANRVASLNLEWEPDILASIADSGIDLSSLFTADEWADVALVEETQDDEDEPVSVDTSQPTRCQPGDVWRVGRHTVACLDSTDVGSIDRVVAGRAVKMVWSDAPYGINAVANSPRMRELGYTQIANDSTTDTARSSARLCLSQWPDSLQIWWGANYFADGLPPARGWIVWDKDHHGMDFADGELAWCNANEPVRCFRHAWSGADRDSEKGEDRVHPNQKPIALCEWAFAKYGSIGDVIVDPFLGSSPSIKAAEKMGRTVIGFELSPHYIDHILEWGEAHGLEVIRSE